MALPHLTIAVSLLVEKCLTQLIFLPISGGFNPTPEAHTSNLKP